MPNIVPDAPIHVRNHPTNGGWFCYQQQDNVMVLIDGVDGRLRSAQYAEPWDPMLAGSEIVIDDRSTRV